MIQVKKTYKEINPELLFAEIQDFTLKQGAKILSSKMETYSLPNDSSSFLSRGTLTFGVAGKAGEADKECLSAHIVGSARGESKLMMDIDDMLFSKEKAAALQEDLDFIFSSYEVNAG